MFLMPKKQKHRKHQKGRIRGNAVRGHLVNFGSFGLKALEQKWITAQQIEATRRVLSRHLGKSGKIWIRIFPDKPITAKGQEMPMGKGKGAIDHYVCIVKPGMMLYEVGGISEEVARKAINAASYKLPIKIKFVTKTK